MAAPIISGIDMIVHDEHTARVWLINEQGNQNKWVGTGVPKGYTHGKGNHDWQGWFKGYGGKPQVFPGDKYTFKASIDGTKGVSGAAICDKIFIRVDREGGKKVEYRVEFSADGILTRGAVTATVPGSGSDIPADARDLVLKLSGAAQENVRWVEFEISAMNRAFSGVTPGQVQRNAGNVIAFLRYGLYIESTWDADLPVLDAVHYVDMYVNATEYWRINWLRVLNRPELTVPMEEQAAVSGLNASELVELGLVGVNGTSTGAIINPSGVTKWS